MNVISAATTNILWPLFLILIGLQKMFGGVCKCCGGK
jgi:hypothetical protein